MHRKKLAASVAALAVATLTFAGCSGNSTSPETSKPSEGGSSSSEPIKVVVFGGVSAEGILANNAATSITAAKASVASVNAAGGIDGRQVEIEVIDDTGDPTVAVTKLKELLASGDKPVAVMNSGPSTVADAMIPILTQNKILSFNIGPTATSADPAQSPYNFDLSPSANDYIKAFVPTMEDKGYEDVAILHGSSAYGELFGKGTSEIFGESGFTVVGNEGYDVAALDMTAQLEALKSKNPDVLVLDAYGAPLGYVLQGIEKLGWDIPIMGNTSVSATTLIATEPPTGVLGTDQVKNLTMQVFTSTKFDKNDAAVNDGVKHMVEAGDIKTSLILAYNLDAMWLVKAAAEKEGSLDAEALVKGITDAQVQKDAGTILIKNYGFTPEKHSPSLGTDEFLFISPGPLVNGQFQ
ncbi:ABC transporter substrate-binding protein [Microbacterium sp. NC79]|uniref:ABC transporter substrate-binding protein n=1 Tax=Microbacterium sp. NC79 TaxID=2851009 RepID=UPI001C2C26D9|nr:ABC transporter substrate-binding protein [Microbacterium sp. NC79]MBV0895748.1 ABC transporter substrate-binding protein [Microbacterium sp. NC79]